MAAATNSVMMLLFSLLGFLIISPAHSLTCTSQNFTDNKLFSNCSDLPSLTAYLHWTYNSTNSSLSIAYIAPPAAPSGWVAWAINPTGSGMIGAQAFIAFQINGSMIVKTFNISSYASVVESKLSFDVWDVSGEQSDGVMTIFATVKVPEKKEVNQVWQVGSAVTDTGRPMQHALDSANLKSKGILKFGVAAEAPPPAESAAPLPEHSPAGNTGIKVIGNCNVGFILFLFLIFGSLIIL